MTKDEEKKMVQCLDAFQEANEQLMMALEECGKSIGDIMLPRQAEMKDRFLGVSIPVANGILSYSRCPQRVQQERWDASLR